LIRESPCYSIVLPRVARPEPRFLSPDQVERLAAAIDPRYEPLIYTGAYLGPRWSELAGLKRSNLDLAGRRIRVIGALERVGNGWRYSDQMKTLHSRRTLSIPRFIADLLAEHVRTAPESEFVFSSPCGGILNYRNFRKRFWDPAVAQAGLLGVTPHALRHTCVTMMIAEGANPLMVQRQLGHADLRMTLGTYGHVFPNWDDDVADRMQELWLRTKEA